MTARQSGAQNAEKQQIGTAPAEPWGDRKNTPDTMAEAPAEERRADTRQPAFRMACIELPNDLVLPCIVKSISMSGAEVALESMNELPNVITLYQPQSRLRKVCVIGVSSAAGEVRGPSHVSCKVRGMRRAHAQAVGQAWKVSLLPMFHEMRFRKNRVQRRIYLYE